MCTKDRTYSNFDLCTNICSESCDFVFSIRRMSFFTQNPRLPVSLLSESMSGENLIQINSLGERERDWRRRNLPLEIRVISRAGSPRSRRMDRWPSVPARTNDRLVLDTGSISWFICGTQGCHLLSRVGRSRFSPRPERERKPGGGGGGGRGGQRVAYRGCSKIYTRNVRGLFTRRKGESI